MLAALFAVTTTTHAGFILDFTESGGNVSVAGSGTINTTALTFVSSAGGPQINPSIAYVLSGASGEAWTGAIGPHSFGSGTQTVAASFSGSFTGVNGANSLLFTPSGYVSGTSISTTSTYTGTFSSLGLTPGTYTYNWGSGATADTFTVQIGAAVPEPSSMILLSLAFGGVGFSAWMRRRRGAVEPVI